MNLVTQLTGNATWASSLQYRDFRILWSSTLLYSLGSGMEQVAVGWLVFDLTGSAFMVGVASAARMAPFFFFGALLGDKALEGGILRICRHYSRIVSHGRCNQGD